VGSARLIEWVAGPNEVTDLYNGRVLPRSFLELFKCQLVVSVDVHRVEDLVHALGGGASRTVR
jgi:hypothetical protein